LCNDSMVTLSLLLSFLETKMRNMMKNRACESKNCWEVWRNGYYSATGSWERTVVKERDWWRQPKGMQPIKSMRKYGKESRKETSQRKIKRCGSKKRMNEGTKIENGWRRQLSETPLKMEKERKREIGKNSREKPILLP